MINFSNTFMIFMTREKPVPKYSIIKQESHWTEICSVEQSITRGNFYKLLEQFKLPTECKNVLLKKITLNEKKNYLDLTIII